MEDLLDPAARNLSGDEVRAEAHATARWIADFLAPSYGPHGGAKLVDGPQPQWLRSGASSLREVPGHHPALDPYVALANSLQRHQGDGVTGGVLLAALLVRHGLEAIDDGVPIPAVLDGYRLAARQAAGVLRGLAAAATSAALLAPVGPSPDWAAPVLAGLPVTADGLDLDAIDVRAEDVASPTWLAGLLVTPKQEPPSRADVTGGVAILTDSWKIGLRAEGATYRIGSAAARVDAGMAEQARRERVVRAVTDAGVRVLLSAAGLDEGLRDALAAQGVIVATDAALSTLRRAETATGARPVSRIEDLEAADVGRGTARRRTEGDGWLLAGSGPAWTLALPAHNASGKAAAKDAGERMLRAAGRIVPDPRGVPGGGVWQRKVAASLRKAADAAPGKAPLAVTAAAKAFDALADALVRNSGQDPLSVSTLADGGNLGPGAATSSASPGRGASPASAVLDSHPIVRDAVSAAFEAATQILRLDGRYDKKPSSTVGMRGHGTPSTLRGMHGDVPPLM